jgi:hypothetical protein
MSLAWAASVAGPARAVPIAIVTEASGKAQMQTERSTVDVAVLTELEPGARAKLDPDARLVVLYVENGEQYSLSGPALVRFAAAGPEALDGAAPLKLRPVAGKDGTPMRIKLASVTQAAVVARSGPGKPVPALSLAGTVTLQQRPVFRWKEAERGLEYQFVLKDDQGAALYSRQVKGDSVELPPDIALVDGRTYRWSVGSRSGMGQNYQSEYRFRVADAATRDAADNLRPAADASVGERVAYALWLMQMELRDEADAVWKQLAAEGVPLPRGRLAAP